MIIQACYRELTAGAEVDAYTAGRIYPRKLPQGATFPAIVLAEITAPRDYDHQGASGIAFPVVQIGCWGGLDYDATLELSSRVARRLSGFSGQLGGILPVRGAFLIDEADMDDPETGWMWRRQDWSFRIREEGIR